MGLKFNNTKLEKTDLTSPFVLDSNYSIEGTLAMKNPARLLVQDSASEFKLDYTKLSIDEKPFELAELPKTNGHYISNSRYVYRLKRIDQDHETRYFNDNYAISTLLKVRYKKTTSNEVCELITSATSDLFIPIEYDRIQILRLSFYYDSVLESIASCGFDTGYGSASSGIGSTDIDNIIGNSRTGAFWAVVSVSDLEFMEILPILKVKTTDDDFKPHFTTAEITGKLTIDSRTVKQGEVWTLYEDEYSNSRGIFAHYNPSQSGSILVGLYPTSSEGASLMSIGELLQDRFLYYKDIFDLNNNTLTRTWFQTVDLSDWAPTLMAKTNFSFK